MKSAYPSSQSFFDASSDSIRAIDVEKCRTNSSFSSLSDLFARNPNGKSDLFTSVRTPVFAPAEVTFPSRKNRECEDRVAEKVSLWHEWGSGESPGEESSGLLSEMLESSSSELVRASSSNLFPNLGSANVSMVPEEFTFPERRKREDESWRERRGFRQDWVPSVPAVDSNVRESTSVTSSVVDFFAKNPAKPSNLLSNSKSTVFSNLGTPVGSQSEFPARRKRNENPFWKDYSSYADVTPSECTTSGSNTSGVNSLSGLYSKSPSGKCSSLFSSLGSANVSSEEVVFPSRKKNPDRNAWRDWSNTGYSDWAEGESEDEILQPKSLAAQKQVQIASGAENLRSFARPLQPAATRKHKKDDSSNVLGLATLDSDHEMAQFTGDDVSRKPLASSVVGPLSSGKEDGKCQARDSVVVTSDGDACNAEGTGASTDGLGLPGTLKEGCGHKSVSDGEDEDGEDIYVEADEDEDGDDICVEGRYRSSRRDLHEQRVSRQKVHSFPPPLGFLGRQGSLRVPHHVPWVQLQPVRSEGRFMLQEVKVTQAVVFEPIREQGRLVLQLIRQEDVGEPIEKNGQGCHTINGDSDTPCKEMIGGHADKSLDAEEKHEKHVSRTMNEPDAVDREHVKEKARKGNKYPKIYPECCLPSAFDVTTTQVEKDADSSVVEQIPPESQESVIEQRTRVAQLQLEEGSSVNCRDSWPDRGCQDRSASHNPSALTSWIVGDDGNEETPALPHRGAEAPSQRVPSWNSPTVGLGDTDSQASYKSAFRSCSPRNAVPTGSGLPLLPLLPILHRSRSIRNTALSEFCRPEGEKEEASKDRWRGREDECYEPRPPFVSSGQGFDGALGSHATAHFLHWSLRKRPEAPGDPDARLTSYPPVTPSFLCADGVGKRHHEKSFWEQPCVS